MVRNLLRPFSQRLRRSKRFIAADSGREGTKFVALNLKHLNTNKISFDESKDVKVQPFMANLMRKV